jgi:phage FluMu protein Com
VTDLGAPFEPEKQSSGYVWNVQCRECNAILRVGSESVRAYLYERAQCPQCLEYPSWDIKESLYWNDEAVEREVTRFEESWTTWMATQEGQLACKKAEFDPRRPA